MSDHKWLKARLLFYVASLICVSVAVFELLLPVATKATDQRGIDLINIVFCLNPARALVERKLTTAGSAAAVETAAPLADSESCPLLVRQAKILSSGSIEIEANIATQGEPAGPAEKMRNVPRREVKILFVPARDAEQKVVWKPQGIPREAFPAWFLK